MPCSWALQHTSCINVVRHASLPGLFYSFQVSGIPGMWDEFGYTMSLQHGWKVKCMHCKQYMICVNLFLIYIHWSILFYYWNIIDLQFLWVSDVQQSDSVTHIDICILFQILFPYRLLQNIEYSSLLYTVGPCWLSILYIVVCIC